MINIPYEIGDTVYYISRDTYNHKIQYGSKLTVVDIQEGIFNTPYVVVQTEANKKAVMHYYRVAKGIPTNE